MPAASRDVYFLASSRLQDLQPPQRWPWAADGDSAVTLQDFLNAAVLMVASARPDAVACQATLALASGAKQTLPADALALIDVLGMVGGGPVTRVDRGILERFNPAWRSAAAVAFPDNFIYDRAASPLAFWVSPPALPGGSLEIIYARRPTKISSPADSLPVSDAYIPALVELVLYQVRAADSEDGDYGMAQAHMAAAKGLLGEKTQIDLQFPLEPKKVLGR